MATRGSWTSPACPRECGHPAKDVPHIFYYHKEDKTWDKLKKLLSIWGEQNKAAPSFLLDIIHKITLWRKVQPLQTPPYLPIPVANTFKKYTNIGWLQALMGLISTDWAEVQNAYLRYLGAKYSGAIWIYVLIRKLWNTEWDIWKFRNHILHATDAPPKTEILALINRRVSLHFNRGIQGLPLRRHFLFKTNIHTLLS